MIKSIEISVIFFMLATASTSSFTFAASSCQQMATNLKINTPSQMRLRQTFHEMGITDYTIQKSNFIRQKSNNQSSKYTDTTLDIQLGSLTKKQFDTLKKYFTPQNIHGENLGPQISYSPSKKYHLIEFLSPVIQALYGRNFTPSYQKVEWPSSEKIMNLDAGRRLWEYEQLNYLATDRVKAEISLNCWGTALAAVRSIFHGTNKVELGWLSRATIGERLSSKKLFDEIEASDVRYGDIMLIHHYSKTVGMETIQHAATIITPGVLFEKVDSGAEDPIRTVYEEDLIAYFHQIFPDEVRISYHRLKPNAYLASAKEADTIQATEDANAFAPLLSSEQLEKLIIGYEFTELGEKPILTVSQLEEVDIVQKNSPSGIANTLDPNNQLSKRFPTIKWKTQ